MCDYLSFSGGRTSRGRFAQRRRGGRQVNKTNNITDTNNLVVVYYSRVDYSNIVVIVYYSIL